VISSDDWLQQAAETIRRVGSNKQALAITGHGSKAFFGQPVTADEALSTTAYSGIVNYDPTELVVVVKCGTPIHELETQLLASRQMLAFEPPRFGGKGTVGGMMATGLSGPRRYSAGAAKDFVLGMTVLDAQATRLRYGGTVMKNVAGYDLSRLHTGALGTLGLIVDLSIKVLPLPPAQATLALQVSASQALEWVNQWGGQPLPISATSWYQGQLMVRLSGAVAAVQSAQTRLGGQVVNQAEAEAFWLSLRDQSHEFFSLDLRDNATHLWRVSVPTTTPHLTAISGEQWIEWGGGLRWFKTDAPADLIRTEARRHGGHATLYRAADPALLNAVGAFAELTPGLMKVHHRLKQELDPHRLFNPGRMFAGI
jgi:glycolate oxidase FAD binding subunit